LVRLPFSFAHFRPPRPSPQRRGKAVLEFTAPAPGTTEYMLYVMCDSYIGTDQELPLALTVRPKVAHQPSRPFFSPFVSTLRSSVWLRFLPLLVPLSMCDLRMSQPSLHLFLPSALLWALQNDEAAGERSPTMGALIREEAEADAKRVASSSSPAPGASSPPPSSKSPPAVTSSA